MIVLTDGKDASIAYCLTTALYCPSPGQYLAIARHKTIRRERKNPHSLFYSSPFTKSSETPINTGVPRGEELAQLFTTLHPPFTWIFYFPSGVCLPPGVPADLQSAVKKCSTYETGGFAIPPSIYKQLAKKSGVKSGEEPSVLFTLPNQLIHKHLRHSGEG